LNQYINIHILEKYIKVGGVRIEDDCAVHADRIEVLSHLVPKEISDIESIMAMA
jgi:Xaa-Pro aminopeptidase